MACLACGLDPGLGVFHVDQNGRDSLALDLMEAVRPQVDAYLLDLLGVRTFSSKDFVETRRGVCRVLAPLTHPLAETTTQWARLIAPVVENVASDACRKHTVAARAFADAADTDKPQRRARWSKAEAEEGSASAASAGGKLCAVRSTPFAERSTLLRRLPARRAAGDARAL